LFNGVDSYRSGVNDACSDVASINLRSLGTGNTLVLLNGKHLVNRQGTQAEGLVPTTTINMNVIPVMSLKRAEIFRDGTSSLCDNDAVAGIINMVLDKDFEGLEAVVKYEMSEGTDLDELTFNLRGGVNFNEGRSLFSFNANHFKREGIFPDERVYSKSSDLRSLIVGIEFEGDTDFRNSGRTNLWRQFQLVQAVRQNGQLITSSTDRHRIQPDSFSGCLTNLNNNLCIDDGNSDASLRYGKNADRSLIPEVDRNIVFTQASHIFTNDIEIYGEASYYDSTSKQFLEPTTAISSHSITVPVNNYWNSFSQVNFSDWRVNHNRLPGIDAPAEGLAMVLDINQETRYRVVDNRIRKSVVNNDCYRILADLRWQRGDWGLDSAILYARANTVDLTENRVSNTLFQQALANETKNIYNPFNGADPLHQNFGDASPNLNSVLENIFVNVKRKNTSTLNLIYFKLSNPYVS